LQCRITGGFRGNKQAANSGFAGFLCLYMVKYFGNMVSEIEGTQKFDGIGRKNRRPQRIAATKILFKSSLPD